MEHLAKIARLFKKERDLNCQEVKDLSSEYLDEELRPSLIRRIRGHLERCERCNAFVSTLRATIDLLRGAPRHKAPPSLKESIRQRVRNLKE